MSEDEAIPAWTVQRLPEERLREFVDGVCSDRIYLSGYVREPRMLGMVFMPLALGLLSACTNPKEIGCAWEWMSAAGPRSINGMPMFSSVKFIHVEDWKRAVAAIQRELERREKIEL